VFTTHTTGLNYGAAAALAAASRALRGYDDALADKCMKTAVQVWTEEHTHPPVIYRSFNTTGGEPDDEEVAAAVELVISTHGESRYKTRLKELLPVIERKFVWLGWDAVRAIPFMDAGYRKALEADTVKFEAQAQGELAKNPFGVPFSTGTWGGSGQAAA